MPDARWAMTVKIKNELTHTNLNRRMPSSPSLSFSARPVAPDFPPKALANSSLLRWTEPQFRLRQRLLQVLDQISGILQSNRNTHGARSHAGQLQLFCTHT